MRYGLSTKQYPEDKCIRVNGLNLHYLDWGGPSSNLLVALHGITGNSHMWDSFAARNRQEFRILALDQRGHGDSDHTKEGYPVTAFASDLYQFTNILSITSFDLLGHSLGARNAISFAGDHSDLLKHAVLVDCGPELPVQGAQGVKKRLGERPLGFRDHEEAITYYRGLYPNRTLEYLNDTAKHSLRLNWAGKLVWKHDPELFWITTTGGKKEIPYLWEQWQRIKCPTLIIRGQQSNILDTDTMSKMLRLTQSAQGTEIKDSGHQIPVEQPDEFQRVVLEFLRS